MTPEFKTSIGPKARRAEEARLSRLCRSIHKGFGKAFRVG
jgi:hypothetical protein